MVIRKHDEADLRPIPPIPTQVVTNGEFVPLPKTQKQREVDLRLMEYADRYGTPRGLSRRRFLMTARSEEHTSELQSLAYLVCRLLLEKKKTKKSHNNIPT